MTKSTGGNWLGVPALAKELGVTQRTVYAILDAGDIPCYRIRRVIRIKRVDLDAYLERVKGSPESCAICTFTARSRATEVSVSDPVSLCPRVVMRASPSVWVPSMSLA